MRKVLSCMLAFAICVLSIFPYVQADNETQNTAIDNLQNQRNEVQNQVDAANEQLEGVQDDLSENLQQVQKLDEKINSSQEELNSINSQMDELQKSIDSVESDLKVAEDNYNKQKTLLDNRLIAIQESEDTKYLDVLLSSKSISEFLSSYFLITELATYDMDLLNEMQEKKDSIENSKNQLETSKEQLATLKSSQTRTAKILENTKTVRENFISKLSDQEKQIQSQIDEYNSQVTAINNEILALAQGSILSQYIGGELAWPVPGYTRITSKYGMRTHPITGVYKLHTGVDIGAPMGANFIAANDGVVTKASYNGAYGNMVIIDHGGGISTLYAHGSEILVQVGQSVKRGDPILKVGSTGYSTGAHAHFEVRINGVVTDPMPYITNGLVPGTQNQDGKTQNETSE